MANSRAKTIDAKTAKEILAEIEMYQKGLADLRRKLLLVLPEKFLKYGSELWWEKTTLKGEEEIKKGNYKVYKNAKDLIADLHKGI